MVLMIGGWLWCCWFDCSVRWVGLCRVLFGRILIFFLIMYKNSLVLLVSCKMVWFCLGLWC